MSFWILCKITGEGKERKKNKLGDHDSLGIISRKKDASVFGGKVTVALKSNPIQDMFSS